MLKDQKKYSRKIKNLWRFIKKIDIYKKHIKEEDELLKKTIDPDLFEDDL